MNQEQPNFHHYLAILYRRRWIIISTFLLVLAGTAVFTFTMTPAYESSTKIMLNDEKGLTQELFEISSLVNHETMIKNQVEILKSRSLSEQVLDQLLSSRYRQNVLGWIDAEQIPGNKVKLLKELSTRTKIAPVRETDVIEIKSQAHLPELAAYIANTISENYYRQSLTLSRGEITEVRQFLESQLQNVQVELKSSEEALKSYQKLEEVAALPEETAELVKQMSTFEALYKEAQTDYLVYSRRLELLKGQLSESKKHLVEKISSISSPMISSLRQKLTELETTRATYLAQGFSSDHPKIIEVGQRLDEIKQNLAEEARKTITSEYLMDDPLAYSQQLVDQILKLEIELESMLARQQTLGNTVEEYNRKMNALPDKSLTLARLERGARVNEKIFLLLQEKYEEAKIQEAGQIGMVRIVDPAYVPTLPIKPKKKLNLLGGALVGLLLGWGLALLRERTDTSVKSMDELEEMGYAVLANIPVINGKNGSPRTRPEKGENGEVEATKIASSLVTHFEPKSAVSEAYRTFRTNIQFAQLDRPVKTLLITSPGPSEGKSTTISNLAITLAQQGIKTVLIDADLRKPVLHSVFNLNPLKGLTHYLMGKAALDQIVQPSGIENLSLISCGIMPPNPAELLGSQKLKELLNRLKSEFDMVLFDSPPVIAVTDAVVLSTLCDGIVLVVSAGETDRNLVRYSSAAFKNVRANFLGTALNKLKMERIYGSYHYYYYSRYRAYESEAKPGINN
ncbi:MAG: polysaccharide biosynthesis tyrosine autokinase [candidate division Zixibacteria bacterium]|nr:polysaccharide biosynthesis tyrosine autokinase [candidate division Zixibacteria bacterium]